MPDAAADQPHVSVLLAEVLAAFEGRQVRRYVDGTLGAAGHAAAMLAQHPELQTLVGFDLDPTAHALASTRLAAAGAKVVPVSVAATGAASYDAAAAAAAAAGPGPAAFLVRSNFGRMARVLQQLPLGGAGGDGATDDGRVDAVLLDLGISSMQVGRDLLAHAHRRLAGTDRGAAHALLTCLPQAAPTVVAAPTSAPAVPCPHACCPA